MTIHQVLTTDVASITDLKRNPMGVISHVSEESGAIAILNRNEPAFYCVTPQMFEYFLELAEDLELAQIATERKNTLEAVKVSL